jgi:2,4-dienoyl-CoA reductase-like NADH-dependent reductase (Old Yellow Enzyme family)
MFEQAVQIGPLRLRNRTIRAAAFEGMSRNHGVTDELIQYHTSVARGGIGMTTVAYAAFSVKK